MNLNKGSQDKDKRNISSHKLKRKLLVQTGILVILVFGTIAILTGVAIRNYCMSLYVDAKEEMIDEDLERMAGTLAEPYHMDYYGDYWEEHLTEFNDMPVDKIYDYFEEVYDLIDGLLEDYKHEDLTEEQNLLMGFFYYQLDRNNLFTEMETQKYEKVYLIDISEENYGLIINTGEEGEEEQGEGDILDLSSFLTREEIRENTDNFREPMIPMIYEKDDTYYYIAIKPMDYQEKTRFALVYLYNMDSFSTSLNRSILIVECLILGILGIAGGLLLLTVYRGALRPVSRIQRNVRIYVEDKDNLEFASNMSKVYAKNEFGALADDLSKLADELQDYSVKNIGLAEENARNATELQLAAKMQSDMLPKVFPDHAQISVAASMTPAKDVGGDLYDVFMVDDDHIAFLIADVAGKGVPAALLGSAVQTIVKYHTVPGVKPSEILFALNNEVCAKELDSMFVTVWLGILNIRTGHMMTSNAGHEYPMFNTGENYEMFKDIHGMPAGSVEGLQYKDHDFWLKKNDRIFVYTDGAAEATNAREEMFETGGILKVLNEDPEREPAEVLKVMKERIDAFVGEAEQFDDLTMLCVRFNGTEG